MSTEKMEVGIGIYGGACNRRVCRQSPATWFNKSTQRFYCHDCAMILNAENEADARRLGIHPLCVEQRSGSTT